MANVPDIVLEHIKVVQLSFSAENLEKIHAFAATCIAAIKNGNKIFVCGNGGSAADAQHFAAELVGVFEATRKPLPAIALTTDTSTITATANDYSYSQIFTRQLRALAKEGDVLIGISTSGYSLNVLDALEWAEQNALKTILLTGEKGENYKYDKIIIASKNTARIQECHIMILHILAYLIEKAFVPFKWG